MRRMTYKTLMRKIEDGYAEVFAWATEIRNSTIVADVMFYSRNGSGKREMVEVTNLPADFEK